MRFRLAFGTKIDDLNCYKFDFLRIPRDFADLGNKQVNRKIGHVKITLRQQRVNNGYSAKKISDFKSFYDARPTTSN